jgi:hypothetical protein
VREYQRARVVRVHPLRCLMELGSSEGAILGRSIQRCSHTDWLARGRVEQLSSAAHRTVCFTSGCCLRLRDCALSAPPRSRAEPRWRDLTWIDVSNVVKR